MSWWEYKAVPVIEEWLVLIGIILFIFWLL